MKLKMLFIIIIIIIIITKMIGSSDSICRLTLITLIFLLAQKKKIMCHTGKKKKAKLPMVLRNLNF